MNTAVTEHYHRYRAEDPAIPARWALRWARHAVEVDALYATVDFDHDWRGDAYPLAVGTVAGEAFEILIYNDDEPYDWGDVEPTEYDRENLQVIGVGVRIANDDDAYARAIWGCGFIDGDMERYAVSVALEHGFIDEARAELAERAEWAARGTVSR